MVLNPRSSATDMIKAITAAAVGLLVLGLFIVFLGGHDFWGDYTRYKIYFKNVKDLTSGRPVKYAGLGVGKVEEINVDRSNPGRIEVIVNVDSDFPIYRGTMATVTQKGLVGDNYVLLELMGDPGPRLRDGDSIPAAVTMSMNDVAAEIGRAVADMAPRLQKILEGIEKLVAADNLSNIRKTMAMAPDVFREANSTLVSFRKEWAGLSGSASRGIRTGTKSLETVTVEVTDTLQKIEGVLATLEGEMSRTLKDVSGEVTRAVDGIDGLTGDLRRNVAYDQEELEMILMNIDRLTREMNRLVRSLRERPWQVLSPPEGASQ